MTTDQKNLKNLLLHACCGPCSMEPVRLLRERGIEPHIYYANSNIAPKAEYIRRLDTIRAWTEEQGIAFTEGEYDPSAWEEKAGCVGGAEEVRKERCRACYRERFEKSAAWAAAHGFDALGTTLSVSPYQFTQIIREELEHACESFGIEPFFEDYSPNYPEAVRRSRKAGMYRQNYCGCRFSASEAQAQRAEREAVREAERARKAKIREKEESRLSERRRERAEYEAKQARKHAILKAMRENRKGETRS